MRCPPAPASQAAVIADQEFHLTPDKGKALPQFQKKMGDFIGKRDLYGPLPGFVFESQEVKVVRVFERVSQARPD